MAFDTWGGSWGTSWGLSWTRGDAPPPAVVVDVGHFGPSTYLKRIKKDRAKRDELRRIVEAAFRGRDVDEPEEVPLVAALEAKIVKDVRQELDVAGLTASLDRIEAMIAEIERAIEEEEEEDMIAIMLLS